SNTHLILRKGVLHKNEIIIDLLQSSEDFIAAIEDLIANNEVVISKNDILFEDFEQLLKMGLLKEKVNSSKFNDFLILITDNLYDIYKNLLPQYLSIKKLSNFLDPKDINILLENKSEERMKTIINRVQEKLVNIKQVVIIASFFDLLSVRACNTLLYKMNANSLIAITDNENIFITDIAPKETGCFECLERQLISQFEGTIDSYLEKSYIDSEITFEKNGEELIVSGLITKEINNMITYGASSLRGNVIHFYLPTYEYSFDTSWINSTCNTCSGIANTHFSEQYIASLNLLKELNSGD
ncbi:hypothetical protein, partial [Listeria valentina]|uniref:hypothetical protein n=1 Tax=Listeria valentina TaxID=2705293 RepID=UPI0014305B49